MEAHMRFMTATFLLVLLSLSAAAPSVRGQAVAAAPAPAAAAPKTIKAVLTKAGQFTKFLQLLQSTQEEEQIDTQLKGKASTGAGLTVFAPPDNAFTALKSGTLNSLSDQQKTSLVQFHVVSQLLPMAQFDTVSNPLRTQAGDTGRGKYPLNVTSDGGGRVNISTGVVNASVDGTLYTGDRLVVYQVDKVLLPWALYGPPVPAPVPLPAADKDKDKKKAGPVAVADAPEADTATASAAAPREMRGLGGGLCMVAVAVAAAWCGM
ncbi:fasciclin-like arabinogalactan protein 11 [Triticum dicoccoides]|uniref:fasciclin-like arabinogalactan protein 11 n=1 Tax=Triticum dicoccoides TaxID=85692 RepID=UPI00188F0485|nr:fasciclin-like arabinogalactan protein 11 [Triticum dicoccoides]